MKRREFIALVGGVAAPMLAPLPLRAQPAMPVVGFLNSASADAYAPFVAAFRRGLTETGFVEGRNVAIEYRFADSQYDRLRAFAAELVASKVAVLFANGPAALTAKAASSTIPIVFTAGFDPIKLGLVPSLARPGGNVTGVSIMNVELGPKRLELLREVVPTATVVGLLVNPANPNAEPLTNDMQAAARSLGLQLQVQRAGAERDFATVFANLAQLRVGALVIGTDPFFTTQSRKLAALAVQHAMPAIYQYRDFVEAGGLISYGSSLVDVYRQAGVYTGRILKGEKPADLPVPQVTKVEMIVNLKTAKALGLTVPLPLLGRADEVIE